MPRSSPSSPGAPDPYRVSDCRNWPPKGGRLGEPHERLTVAVIDAVTCCTKFRWFLTKWGCAVVATSFA